jgi:DNA polymerase I-like protein with 3'-5' exonuclease and polymerase domains
LAQAPSPWDLIAPDDGWELWTLDLAQAELRVAALYAKCQAMLDIIAANRDPHGETATSLWHITPDDPAWDVYRGVGKRANFSLIFGIGPDRFRDDTWSQTGVDLGQGATRKLHRDWHKLYPEFKAAINIYMRLAERDGYTHIRDGIRRYYSEIEVATHDQHKAFSSKVQGNLGYFGRAWMVKVNEFVKQHVDPAHGLLLQVHDAVYLELPQDAGQQLAGQCADIGRQLWERWFPGVPGDVDTKRVH